MVAPELVVAFVQRDRPEYTRRTLDSFVKHAAGIAWEGWFADDASTRQGDMIALAESRGMKPLVVHERPSGCTVTTKELVGRMAEKYPPQTLCLYLQNDFEFLRPLPLRALVALMGTHPNVGWVRMAGFWNSGYDQPPIDEYWSRGRRHSLWSEITVDGERFEIGDSYFSYNPPSVTPIWLLYCILLDSRKETDTAANAATLKRLAARFRDNVAIHIGKEKTVGFRD